uniref:Uncharacterized protein n=1 Tax=Oryza rufipogon TaxID=4529 RepID=A0A0E0QPM0_ORYRU
MRPRVPILIPSQGRQAWPCTSTRSARLSIIIELGIEACCNCFLPICVAYDAVTRPIELEAAAGAIHPLSSWRDAAFFRCSERRNKQHRHAAAAAVARLAPGWLRELLCDRCANEQSKAYNNHGKTLKS